MGMSFPRSCVGIFIFPSDSQFSAQRLPPTLAELRGILEVLDDQQLQLLRDGCVSQVEQVGQLFDGAALKVSVPRRRIFVSLEGGRGRPVVWFPGSTPEQIEDTVVKACGLPPGTSVEVLEGDTTVVISPTIPNDTRLTVVPLGQKNGHAERQPSPGRLARGGESPRAHGAAKAAARRPGTARSREIVLELLGLGFRMV
ncbi:hypothetical protein AK812_SmicGene44541 [Symbiodinium microadriaticum]|uniref:Uncharacterized protein n=1 Tax=Symbiodinium microadriaticum TaxID=2951 RepID=A0A1Q9BY76_SYMMI|nr:hypothetical protein AK812_SmicGene44541 [Symbiodinium microadriaticum]